MIFYMLSPFSVWGSYKCRRVVLLLANRDKLEKSKLFLMLLLVYNRPSVIVNQLPSIGLMPATVRELVSGSRVITSSKRIMKMENLLQIK